jgi:hypothetical protein
MRSTYRFLASAIAVLVVIQAMMMVWAIAGLFAWIDDGATLDKSVMEGWADEPPTFDGAIGHFVHVMSGTFLIPLLGLLLLIVSFFAKVPRGVALAAVVVVSIVVQYLAGTFAELGGATLGIIHGLNAFILFGVALAASKAAKEAGAATTPETQPAAM